MIKSFRRGQSSDQELQKGTIKRSRASEGDNQVQFLPNKDLGPVVNISGVD